MEAEYDANKRTTKDDIRWLFFGVMLGDQGQQRGQWLMLQVDARDNEEIVWQAQEMLAGRGFNQSWEWDPAGKTVIQGLADLSHWLAPRQLSLLVVDYESDSYYAVIVEDTLVQQAFALAQEGGVKLTRFDEFAAKQDQE